MNLEVSLPPAVGKGKWGRSPTSSVPLPLSDRTYASCCLLLSATDWQGAMVSVVFPLFPLELASPGVQAQVGWLWGLLLPGHRHMAVSDAGSVVSGNPFSSGGAVNVKETFIFYSRHLFPEAINLPGVHRLTQGTQNAKGVGCLPAMSCPHAKRPSTKGFPLNNTVV